MVEAEGGYYIAGDVNIVKAGKANTDDEEEETPKEPYTKNGNNYTINTPEGMQNLLDDHETEISSANITLACDVTLPDTWPEGIQYTGTLNGGDHTLTISGDRTQGLFETIESGGTVENLNINVTGSISSSASAGTYAYAGAVAGINRGIVSGCTVTASGKISASVTGGGYVDGKAYAGGVAGYNLRGTVNGSGTLKEGGVIKATVGENTATIPSENQGDPVIVGSARAGTICGFSTSTT